MPPGAVEQRSRGLRRAAKTAENTAVSENVPLPDATVKRSRGRTPSRGPKLPPVAIFKAYDIRGVFPDELDAAAAYRIGRATARFLGNGPIVVGRDARTSSPSSSARSCAARATRACRRHRPRPGGDADALLRGRSARRRGRNHDHRLAQSGRYNGFKICRENAIPIGEASGLKEIESIANALADGEASVAARRRARGRRHRRLRRARLWRVGSGRPSLRVAIDGGNGMAAAGWSRCSSGSISRSRRSTSSPTAPFRITRRIRSRSRTSAT